MTHEVERVLADVDADHGDRCVEFLRHGVLLVVNTPCQLLILAGPEHGPTIPLAVFKAPPFFTTSAKVLLPQFLSFRRGRHMRRREFIIRVAGLSAVWP